ncbi:MAG: hypothetical protein NQU42_07315 [Methanothrix sp.]|nr:hypothetical protein [Methanothrix sp.]MCQ8903882.1 hypothetical protein [Methanothrix sp.]
MAEKLIPTILTKLGVFDNREMIVHHIIILIAWLLLLLLSIMCNPKFHN